MHFTSFLATAASIMATTAQLSSLSLTSSPNSLGLSSSFNPIIPAYWTGLPHHRRTPLALSPSGTTGYIAYLDASGSSVHVQSVTPTDFTAGSVSINVSGAKEAGGLVAHDDGFALLTSEELPTGTTDAPPSGTPVAVLYRFDASGNQVWKTYLGGPNIDSDNNLASPDINGDLVFSEKAGYYAAYIVVTSYSGSASGHFGDAIRYVATDGNLTNIAGASSSWGCSHNTGIAFEAADAAPFASLCAEDQGAIWLNTKTQGMTNDGVKVSNEHVINGASNEAMGGMSGSYSSLARFGGSRADSDGYIFTWVSRGAIDLTENTWMGDGYTTAKNRTVARNVAIAVMSDKNTLVGQQAASEVGATDGDSQVNWLTTGSADRQNAHVATFDSEYALVSWEEIAEPECDFDAMGCKGTFSGTFYQLVDSSGKAVGESKKSMDTFVAGDMVSMGDGRICWPYVAMDWRLDATADQLTTTSDKISFACISLNGTGTSTSASSSTSATVATSTIATSTAASPSVTSGVEAVERTSVQQGTLSTTELSSPALGVITSAKPISPSVAAPTTFQTLVSTSTSSSKKPKKTSTTCKAKRGV